MNFSSFVNLSFYDFLNFSRSFDKELSFYLLTYYKKSQTSLFPLFQMDPESDSLFIVGEIFSILEKEIGERYERCYLFLENIFLQNFLQKEEDEPSSLKEKIDSIRNSPDILSSHKILVIESLKNEFKKASKASTDKEALCFYYAFLSLIKDKFTFAIENFLDIKNSYKSLLRLREILEESPLPQDLYNEWASLFWAGQRNLKEISLLSDEGFLASLKESFRKEGFNFNMNNFYLLPYNNYEDSFKISLVRGKEKSKDIVDIYESYQKALKEWF